MSFDEKKWGMTFEEAVKQLDEDLCVIEDEKIKCCIGLRATFYFFKGRDPEVRENVLRVFDRYLTETTGRLRWGADPRTGRPRKLAGTDIANPAVWSQLSAEEDLDMVFHGAENRDDASAYTFVALAEETMGGPSFVTFTLPLSWLKGRGLQAFIELVLDCCGILTPYHGYAGLSVIQHVNESGGSSAMMHIQGLAFRFLGLEVDFPEFHASYLDQAIKGVNWLTVLEKQWFDKLGGRDGLQRQLGEGFVYHDYPGGVVIQAGPRPLFGDVNRREDLPYYKKLARALKPIRVEYEHSMASMSGGAFDIEKTREWFNRFDEDKW